MRRALHLGVVSGLLLAFAQAPFLHVHDRDHGHEHSHGFAHAHSHWPLEHSDNPALEAHDHDSDARFLDWIAGDGTSDTRLAAALPVEIVIPDLIEHRGLAPGFTPRNHDPPWRVSLKARAPPA